MSDRMGPWNTEWWRIIAGAIILLLQAFVIYAIWTRW